MSVTELGAITVPARLSYSSLNSYAECGERWKLEKGYGLNKATWFATVAGSAIHTITEQIDMVEVGAFIGPIPTFQQMFDHLLAIEKRNDVLVKPSGKKQKTVTINGGPDKKDYDWWLEFGPLALEQWETWKQSSNWTLAVMPDGSPGVEVVLRQQMAGENHLGFIDRVYITPQGQAVIVDLKNGAVPTSPAQLGTYRVGLLREFGIDAQWGAYWMSKDGELTGLKDLTMYTEEYIDSQYAQAWRGIRAGVFLPHVTGMCVGCGVKDYCRAVGGSKSHDVPVNPDIVLREADGVASSAPSV
ncbi:PD-(D/E)XK nuclease family protein [Rhodococcus antarcticus]|uniref:PD-(D/E)XK nuclease family protein n=1 Tax=Rhodococcus antarcticus TaxID=2987751 RepID=A0ABY6NWG3_9NOCA|nr:PD-(D/E)XK nuclease family protein [Rhodococcus antarcticus]UZJ23732.1 PD-(D/E)XK nuclease family protein [Rhodococcus antarcticus]